MCEKAGCQRQAQHGPRTQDRCARHMLCAAENCPGETSYEIDTPEEFSPYCTAHRCSTRPCTMQAGTILPTGFRFCNIHASEWQCASDGCALPRSSGPTGPAYCAAHMYCSTASCKRSRCMNSQFCRLHTCVRNGCNAGVPTKLTSCEAHTCKANMEDDYRCTLPTTSYTNKAEAKWSEYCALHICEVTLRMDQPCLDQNDNRSYCKEHRCSEHGCDHPRPWDPQRRMSSTMTICADHQRELWHARQDSPMEAEETAREPATVRFAGIGFPTLGRRLATRTDSE